MKKVFLAAGLCYLVTASLGQSLSQRLEKSYQQFVNDSQLKFAISSIYVIDAKTGEVLFDKNSTIGLAPASTQKIIIAASAFEILGKGFQYKTEIGVIKKNDSALLYIHPSGDPTFGSWRWATTKDDVILAAIAKTFSARKINLASTVILDQKGWDPRIIPDGWIWQDIGNYYGAGAGSLNWKENQFDMFLSSGPVVGDPVIINKTDPPDLLFKSFATSAAEGTGDNAYIYLPLNSPAGTVQGTIPVREKNFEISGAVADPQKLFINQVRKSVAAKSRKFDIIETTDKSKRFTEQPIILYKHYSPALDSIIYWFLRKSINLYGEALIKTMAYNKLGIASTDSGITVIKKCWQEKGIDVDELNMYDGSGLSPLNRVTTHAQVEILKYARSKEWFIDFYKSFPEFNDMKMKSGTINNVKGYCGYHTSADGHQYIFSFLVNNYNGKASALVSKMYKVLNELK